MAYFHYPDKCVDKSAATWTVVGTKGADGLIANCGLYTYVEDSANAGDFYLYCMRCKTGHTAIIKEGQDSAAVKFNYLDTCSTMPSCDSSTPLNTANGIGKIVNETKLLGVVNSYSLETLFSCL